MKTLSNTELTTFCSQFALILRSGISSLEGLSIMQEDSPKGEGQELLSGMIRTMEETGSLYEALTASEVFPPYLCSMVEILYLMKYSSSSAPALAVFPGQFFLLETQSAAMRSYLSLLLQ